MKKSTEQETRARVRACLRSGGYSFRREAVHAIAHLCELGDVRGFMPRCWYCGEPIASHEELAHELLGPLQGRP